MSKPTSPCKDECAYDWDLHCCISCGRTIEDIDKWSVISEGERRRRTALAERRLQKLKDEGLLF